MVKTASTMLTLGTPAPAFEIPDPTRKIYSLNDFRDAKALLVIFMCNHCPFVKHVAAELVRLHRDYASRGVAVVGISSNDPASHPEDGPDRMALEAETQGYRFPYLFDGSQEVAKAYRAACTPDFFLFDTERKLFYRGQLDSSRPRNGIPVDGSDLRAAIDRLLAGEKAPEVQKPSIGCNIKWKSGGEPEYFDARGVQ